MPSDRLSEGEKTMPRRGQNIYHRKDGRWEGRYYQKGSRKYKSVYGRTYSEAKEKLRKLTKEVFVPSHKCDLHFSDIMKLWLENRRIDIKVSSYYCYKHKLNKHILPYFGSRLYSKLTAADLERFKADMLGLGYSDKYVADMVVMIKSAANYTMKVHNYSNPFVNFQPPKMKRREAIILSEQQQNKFIQHCVNNRSLVGMCCFFDDVYGTAYRRTLCAQMG